MLVIAGRIPLAEKSANMTPVNRSKVKLKSGRATHDYPEVLELDIDELDDDMVSTKSSLF